MPKSIKVCLYTQSKTGINFLSIHTYVHFFYSIIVFKYELILEALEYT